VVNPSFIDNELSALLNNIPAFADVDATVYNIEYLLSSIEEPIY